MVVIGYFKCLNFEIDADACEAGWEATYGSK